MTTRFADHIIGPGTHASRPAASAVPAGAVYACTTDSKLEQSNGSAWSDYFSGGGGGSSLTVDDEGTPLATAATTLDFVGAGVTASGTGATKTITIPGGGGITHAYVGYNTVGGTWENMTVFRVLAKKVTLASAGLLAGLEAYVQNTAASNDAVESLVGALYDDSSGTPNNIIAYSGPVGTSILMDDTSGGGAGSATPRWLSISFGGPKWLVAGDYWLALGLWDAQSGIQIAYDATGSDRYYTSGSTWFADWGYYSPTTTANKYSIRASLIT